MRLNTRNSAGIYTINKCTRCMHWKLSHSIFPCIHWSRGALGCLTVQKKISCFTLLSSLLEELYKHDESWSSSFVSTWGRSWTSIHSRPNELDEKRSSVWELLRALKKKKINLNKWFIGTLSWWFWRIQTEYSSLHHSVEEGWTLASLDTKETIANSYAND